MIATIEITEATCRAAAAQYLAQSLGAAFQVGRGQLVDGIWRFTVIEQRSDMVRVPAVGTIAVEAVSGHIHTLTAEQLRNLREAGAVQAAQERRELARDDNGYVLRRHARIKANCWLSDHVGMKIGAEGGHLLIQEPPIWRFSVVCHLRNLDVCSLGTIDVDAINGQVMPLPETQIQTIQEAVSAAVRYQKQTATR